MVDAVESWHFEPECFCLELQNVREREREGERRYKNVPPIFSHKQARGASNDVFSFLTTARLSDRLSVYLFFFRCIFLRCVSDLPSPYLTFLYISNPRHPSVHHFVIHYFGQVFFSSVS